jgi:hypothetical protein
VTRYFRRLWDEEPRFELAGWGRFGRFEIGADEFAQAVKGLKPLNQRSGTA